MAFGVSGWLRSSGSVIAGLCYIWWSHMAIWASGFTNVEKRIAVMLLLRGTLGDWWRRFSHCSLLLEIELGSSSGRDPIYLCQVTSLFAWWSSHRKILQLSKVISILMYQGCCWSIFHFSISDGKMTHGTYEVPDAILNTLHVLTHLINIIQNFWVDLIVSILKMKKVMHGEVNRSWSYN